MHGLVREKGIDWYAVDRSLMHNHGLMPWVIDELTIIEIIMFLEEPEPQNQSEGDFRQSISDWRGMSPKQKLLAKRAGLR